MSHYDAIVTRWSRHAADVVAVPGHDLRPPWFTSHPRRRHGPRGRDRAGGSRAAQGL